MMEKGNLIKLADVDRDFIIDLKYATADNFTGIRIYQTAECYMDRHTAEILIQARDMFKQDGYRLKIWDAYRPVSAQKKFWDIMPDDNFIARPPDLTVMTEFRPTHMNGMCVDVTLTDMDGNELEMPSQFDELSEKAALACETASETGRKNGQYLKNIMESVGFQAYDCEWWHFYDVSATPAPFTDYEF